MIYGYDPVIGRLETVTQGTRQFKYSYETGKPSPLPQLFTRPEGHYSSYGYNIFGQLASIANKNSSNQVIDARTFTYKDNGSDLIATEEITNGLTAPVKQGADSYDYNLLNQLLKTKNLGQLFSYDADGNMVKGYTSGGFPFNASYDAQNRLTSISFTDGDGIAKRTEYLYAGDSLISRTREYAGNVLTSDTQFLRSGLLPLQERDGSNTVTRSYLWNPQAPGGIGGLLGMKENNKNYTYLYDGNGNVTTVLDDTQNVAALYGYQPFGEPTFKGGALDQPYRFSTKRYDENTGLSYYGYRFYNPTIGRWMNRDPLGFGGGDLNLYGMVGQNPGNWVDPEGL